ncbi:hypothetical protein AKJ63_00460 [candidate division MSBL1 archaeon SCGC-AAA259D18]|uniref:Uncharacterized protein n=1 Tax=candidate division MSBL1 archaeon SCGC-AAA259D18 TaxID=1698262 RepID=A0A133UCL1_9EURY|nr:hypothetical protein AKJ63_00460 [candidate division MSBL1 archaeon SCGC-AAA259D18]
MFPRTAVSFVPSATHLILLFCFFMMFPKVSEFLHPATEESVVGFQTARLINLFKLLSEKLKVQPKATSAPKEPQNFLSREHKGELKGGHRGN